MTKTISTAEAARRLGVSTARVKVLLRDERLKGEKVGRDWRIRPDAVEEFQRMRDLLARPVGVIGG